jgi:Cu+-exporting ATPase
LQNKTSISPNCSYCGTHCDSNLVVLNEKKYCCYGCATLDDVVNKILNTTTDVSLKYKQFDLPENFDQLVDYQNENIYRISISLPSIHCSSCIELLEDLPSFKEGILASRVNFEQRRCTITARKSVPLSYVSQLLEDIGYAPQLSISEKLKEQDREENRSNLLKLAVAGFCFGNIMLFSFPHYFGLQVGDDLFFSRLFSGLSIALSLPALFYAGRSYLTSAYSALAAGKSHLNIPISIGLLSLFGWSLYEIFSGEGIGYLDSLAGLIFFLLIGKWFQHKVYDQVSYQRSVQDFIPLVVRKLINNEVVWERIDNLNEGDCVTVKNGEIIPVNGILTHGNGYIDYSFITGESIPERVAISQKVYAGGSQQSGEIIVTLSEAPSIEKLWDTWNTKSENKDFANRWTDKISKYFTIAVLLIAIVAAVSWYYIDPSKIAFVFSSVLIVACPCALALSAPFTYGNMIRVFSKNLFFVKSANSIGTLARLRHFVFDKTGTLTQQGSNEVVYKGEVLSIAQKRAIYTLASQSNHPISQIILGHLQGIQPDNIENFEEIAGSGVSGIVRGQSVKLGSSQWLLGQENSLNKSAVYVYFQDKVIGHFQIAVSFRVGLKNVLNQLSKRYSLSILSGDNESSKHALEQLFGGFNRIIFNLKPKAKAEQISDLKKTGEVAMIGDGLNDSSAIQEGDFGIAITENLNGFYPGADAVLLAKSFNKLPAFCNLVDYSNEILKWSLAFSLTYNVAGITIAVLGMLTPIIAAILMPLSSISVVLLVTFLVRNKAKHLQLI